jgi:hypothetical protein
MSPPMSGDTAGRVCHHGWMTRELRVVGRGIAPDVLARVASATRLATLEEVLRFGFAQRPSWELAEVVVQDEYTHDVIIEAPAYLVFDTT